MEWLNQASSRVLPEAGEPVTTQIRGPYGSSRQRSSAPAAGARPAVGSSRMPRSGRRSSQAGREPSR
ncbi:hypothetical protein [Nonomuraea dietziae]|uniref:hypothetical protein n=1 Tax=Nonomuraea dietziae TaxID=65515 RepID=UPI0031E383A8